MEKKNRKLRLNKMTVAELNQSEQAAIYGGLPYTVTVDYLNEKCAPEAVPIASHVQQCTLGTECARSNIGEVNCKGGYTFDNQARSCAYGCNTAYSICDC
jgi:hypothetical protein